MEENDMSDDDDITQENKADNNTEKIKRLKTEDSGVSIDAGTSSEETQIENNSTSNETSASTSFPKPTNSKRRNYRKPENDSNDDNSNEAPPVPPSETEPQESGTDRELTENIRNHIWYMNFETQNNSNSSTDEERESSLSQTFLNDSDTESDVEDPPVLSKEKPKHKWFMVPEILNRQIGTSARYKSSELFQQRCYGSLHSVQRLELMYKLEKHEGCVNSLNFHPNGSLLASGSDDLSVVVWDWPTGKELIAFDTKHRGNVFQSKFLPLSGDLHIVTCARDGQVRLHQVCSTEGLRSSRKLGVHKGPTHKLALLKDQPHIVLSVGEDGCVISHDVRIAKPLKILTVQTLEDRKIALYSINSHPLNSHQFCVSGRDHLVRIYDQRKIQPVMATFFPGHIKKKADMMGLHVTCAVYNYNGTEILASYNDDDIYLFDAAKSTSTYIHCYQGHRNGATIKGVNFFGPKSEYIVSGSDCGNIYFWDKNTESIVQWMLADDNGVVNCLEPHPQLPIICTSGLDCDVKVWVPSNEQEPPMAGLSETVRKNHRCRDAERIYHSNSDINDSQMLWMLWRHLRTTERMQRQTYNTGEPETEENSSNVEAQMTLTDSSDSDDDDSSDGDDDINRTMSCSPS